MIVPRGDEGLVEPLFVVGLPRSYQLPSMLVFDFYPVKCQHHVVGFQVPPYYLGIAPELFRLFFAQRLGIAVEPRLVRIRKDPLNKTVVSLQLFIIVIPSLMNLVDIFPIRLRRHLIQVKFYIDLL